MAYADEVILGAATGVVGKANQDFTAGVEDVGHGSGVREVAGRLVTIDFADGEKSVGSVSEDAVCYRTLDEHVLSPVQPAWLS